VAQEDGRDFLLDALTDFARAQRLSGFHQDHATRFGKAGLATARLAINQVKEFFIENVLAEHIRKTNNRLFDGSDALHDFCALFEQDAQLFMSRLQHFLNMRIRSPWHTPPETAQTCFSVGSNCSDFHCHPPMCLASDPVMPGADVSYPMPVEGYVTPRPFVSTKLIVCF
jgi:hypothetical protein